MIIVALSFISAIFFSKWGWLNDIKIYQAPPLKLEVKAPNTNGLNHIPVEFIGWFVGFTDGEGNFFIKIDKAKNFVGFRFKINLHLDDLNTLEYIKENLGVGRVKSLNDRTVTFEITNSAEIKQIIIPLFTNYPLLTVKKLNFEKFKSAFEMKYNYIDNSFNLILDLKNNMNTKLDYSSKEVSDWNKDNLLNGKITPYWLLGFMEAEGTFGIKNLRPYFQISQHECSRSTLELIQLYFENLLENKLVNYSSLPLIELKFTRTLNKKTNVYSYVVSGIDTQYYYILPFFYNLQFKSRKGVDFKLWMIALLLYKRGYFYTDQGRNLLVDIINNINTKRYSTQPLDYSKNLDLKKINDLFNSPSPILEDPKSFLPHIDLVRKWIKRTKKVVYVYNNGTEIQESPFQSYSAAQKFWGFKTNTIIARYINTNKIYQDKTWKEGKWTFYSYSNPR